jgi:hypothetical protein
MEVNIHMARQPKAEINKGSKKNTTTKVVTTETKKSRGREKGFTVEPTVAIINITDTPYRIDESDGRNKIIQKLITKVRTKEEKDDEFNKGVKVGEEYTRYVNVLKCYRSDYKSAFYRLHEVMVEDEIEKRKIVSLEEFLKIYREMNVLLDKTFPVKAE